MRIVRPALILAVLLGVAPAVLAQVDARLLQQPAVSATQVAFIYAGDVWVAPREGGLAQRLSTPAGDESLPRFSPDGKWLAFTGDYDGNEDVYVMPAMGGMPRRVTHHPFPDRMLGWYPDGKELLIASPMQTPSRRFDMLYRVPVAGGLPEKLPVPYGELGAISPDGRTLAYCPNARDWRTWKRYRGGWASRIFLFDLASHQSRQVGGDDEANYSDPMWHGRTLYLLSDRGEAKRGNIWAYDQDTGALRQVTHFTDYDVHFPSAGPDAIVFENGGRLWLLDLETEQPRQVDIQVVTDEASLRPRAEKVADRIMGAAVSPSAKRVFLDARGDLFSLPAEHGPTYDLTRTAGVAERYPSLSPDGRTLAYWSDRTGEYELTVRPADGSGEERTVTDLGPGYRYRIFWAPDGKSVVFADQSMAINVCDLATGKVTRMDRGLDLMEGGLEGFTASWSPDSRYVAWARSLDNKMGAVFIFDTRSGRTTQATSGFYNDDQPAFDPDGKYLYYVTWRDFTPLYGRLDGTWIYANGMRIAAVPLAADGASPLAPRNDVEPEKADGGKAGDKGEKGKGDKGDKADEKAAPAPVTLDLAGFEQRVVLLPPAAGRYADLGAVAGKVLYRRPAPDGSPPDSPSPLMYYDLEEREEKTILPDAGFYLVAADGETLLVNLKDDWALVPLQADQKLDKKLDLSGLEMTVDPRAEWNQIFTDAWRFERDFFYDPGMHGVDWKEMRGRYGSLIDQCATRSDVNFVLGELIGELNSSHTYRGGGDLEHPLSRSVGLLGCDFTVADGAFRFARILQGAPWDVSPRSPLSEPGVGVKEGDYLLAVNGVPVDTGADPWAAFQGLADQTVSLTVNDRPSPKGARTVLVATLSTPDEMRLRNLAWIDANRRRVDEASGGRLGYIYVPDTGLGGQRELYRQFLAQSTKDGLVIDERFNSGGQIPDRFIELLNRPILSYWHVRDGRDGQTPEIAHLGPKVMLINGWSGSGGDCFPYYFRETGLGPLIGERTWGGLIGISGSPELVDGGGVTVPTFSFYTPEGQWAVEGHGVDPDIRVPDDPTALANGHDPQLERGIEEAMKLLAENPPTRPQPPANPKR